LRSKKRNIRSIRRISLRKRKGRISKKMRGGTKYRKRRRRISKKMKGGSGTLDLSKVTPPN